MLLELGKGQVRTLVENVLIPQVGNRLLQVEIEQKNQVFAEITWKYCF